MSVQRFSGKVRILWTLKPCLQAYCRLVTDITLDVGFKDFYGYCKQADVPVVIISR